MIYLLKELKEVIGVEIKGRYRCFWYNKFIYLCVRYVFVVFGGYWKFVFVKVLLFKLEVNLF